MVTEAGIEPACPYWRGILSPLCLPIPPLSPLYLTISNDLSNVNRFFKKSSPFRSLQKIFLRHPCNVQHRLFHDLHDHPSMHNLFQQQLRKVSLRHQLVHVGSIHNSDCSCNKNTNSAQDHRS